MTCPEIGNYGVSPEDVESRGPQVAGFIIRDESPVASNWRADRTLRDYLVAAQDRRHLGHRHACADAAAAVGRRHARRDRDRRGLDPDALVDRARSIPKMEGSDLVKVVTSAQPFDWPQEDPDEFGIEPGRRAKRRAEDCGLRLRHEMEHPAAAERARLRRARVSRERRRPRSCSRPSRTACS